MRLMEWKARRSRDPGGKIGPATASEADSWPRASVDCFGVASAFLAETRISVALEPCVKIVKSFETSSVSVDISGISRQARQRNRSTETRTKSRLFRFASMKNIAPRAASVQKEYRNFASPVKQDSS